MKSFQMHSLLNNDITPHPVQVEVALRFQIPTFHILGLAGPDVQEARERIRSAIEASGFEFPRKKIIINLSPASEKKSGSGHDLSMAIAILKSAEKADIANKLYFAWGELGLNGTIESTGQMMRVLTVAIQSQSEVLIVSETDAIEARALKQWLIKEKRALPEETPIIIGAKNLKEAISFLKDPQETINLNSQSIEYSKNKNETISALFKFPVSIEKTLLISTFGHHNLLVLGPKGSGKTHALDWISSFFPEVSAELKQMQFLIQECSNGPAQSIRRVSSQIRPSSLIGSSQNSTLRPGELSLAHGGILIADEFLEWHRDSREILREPLERGAITLTRNTFRREIPAQFLFLGTSNLCPCGGHPRNFPTKSLNKKTTFCRCSLSIGQNYVNRLSGPILDRIDIVLPLFASLEPPRLLTANEIATVKQKTIELRQAAIDLWGCAPGLLRSEKAEEMLSKMPRSFLTRLSEQTSSLRSRHRVFRVSLSLALTKNREQPNEQDLIESIGFRNEEFFESLFRDYK